MPSPWLFWKRKKNNLMSVKIVTDSTADLSPNFTNDFGITMVPIYAFRSKEQAGLKGISTEDNLIDDDVFQRQ
jgi:fatty acid-binding protein DegV